MSNKTIHAYTEHVPQPAYVNLREDGGLIALTVRSPGFNGVTGPSSTIHLTRSQLDALAEDALKYLEDTQ